MDNPKYDDLGKMTKEEIWMIASLLKSSISLRSLGRQTCEAVELLDKSPACFQTRDLGLKLAGQLDSTADTLVEFTQALQTAILKMDSRDNN